MRKLTRGLIKRILLCIILIGLIKSSFSQVNTENFELPREDIPDTSLSFYSHLLGFQIDEIHNPKLYQTVGNWLKTPYCYGGKGRKGIDCSDFASLLYDSAYNYHIQAGSKNIYYSILPVEKSKLKEGDLVFFKIKNGLISHVGVYLSKNKFAHATVNEGVVVSDLSEPYYMKYFFKGGRIFDPFE